jgi:hypothetical protein
MDDYSSRWISRAVVLSILKPRNAQTRRRLTTHLFVINEILEESIQRLENIRNFCKSTNLRPNKKASPVIANHFEFMILSLLLILSLTSLICRSRVLRLFVRLGSCTQFWWPLSLPQGLANAFDSVTFCHWYYMYINALKHGVTTSFNIKSSLFCPGRIFICLIIFSE